MSNKLLRSTEKIIISVVVLCGVAACSTSSRFEEAAMNATSAAPGSETGDNIYKAPSDNAREGVQQEIIIRQRAKIEQQQRELQDIERQKYYNSRLNQY